MSAEALTTALREEAGGPIAALCEAVDPPPADVSPPERTAILLTLASPMTAPLRTVEDERAAERVTLPALWRLRRDWQQEWLASLETGPVVTGSPHADPGTPAEQVVRGMRTLAAGDRLPAIYRWVGSHADAAQLRTFLALEGGPDGGFDDLVAACQIGLVGAPKLELARNYWDEMGNGDPSAVHTVLYEGLVAATGLSDESPAGLAPGQAEAVMHCARERALLGALLATDHALQPELLGVLGLTELQAGPRCRMVQRGLERTGLADAAGPFYAVHADVDPIHGRDWVDKALVPLVSERPHWVARILRGARWRSLLNARLFAAMTDLLCADLPDVDAVGTLARAA